MDALAGLLDGPRAHGAFLLRSSWTAPWGLRILAESPLTLLAVPRGELWILPDGGDPLHVGTGDVAITRGPDHYSVVDDPDTEPTITIFPGQDCRDENGDTVEESMSLGVRSWGNHHEGETIMMVGAYHSFGEIGDRLLRTLPPVLVLPKEQWECPLVPVLDDEVVKDHPGQVAVLDRLLDLVVIAALREWFDRPDAEPPAWYRALSDPVVGTAIQLMQANPAEPWTVSSIASATGVSRAVLAKRFTEILDEPPMTFLTNWRIDLAADLLRQPDLTLGAVAQRVGYSTPFALSSAFKRVRGVSPQVHRDAVAT